MSMHTERPVPMHVDIIGTGMISGIYLKTMTERMDILQVDAIAGRNLEKTRAAAEKYGLRASTTDEILADPSIDIVLVLTGPATHEEIISKALNAGKHVYTEKSFALEAEAGKRLQDNAVNSVLPSAPVSQSSISPAGGVNASHNNSSQCLFIASMYKSYFRRTKRCR